MAAPAEGNIQQATGQPVAQPYPQAQAYPQAQPYPQAQGYPQTGQPVAQPYPQAQGYPQTGYATAQTYPPQGYAPTGQVATTTVVVAGGAPAAGGPQQLPDTKCCNCCCCDVRGGVMTIAILLLIGTVIQLIQTLTSAVAAAAWAVAIDVILSVASLVFCVLGIMGASNYNPQFVFAFYCYLIGYVAFMSVYGIVVIGIFASFGVPAGFIIFFFIFGFGIWIALGAYYIWEVKRFYDMLIQYGYK